MIAKIRQRLPAASLLKGRLLDRVILWSGILLVISVVAFGAYYYVDQESKRVSDGSDAVDREITRFEEAARNDPDDVSARVGLADLYYARQRFADAAAQYEAALTIDDENTVAMVGLGRALIGNADNGDLERAVTQFQKVVDQAKGADIPGDLVQAAHYYLGSVYLTQQRQADAIAELKLAVEMERTDADAWYALGVAYMDNGDLDEAIDALSTSVVFVPNFAEAYERLATAFDQKGLSAEAQWARGMLAYSRGQLDDAASLLEAAVQAAPALARAHVGLGLVRESRNENEMAIKAYQAAVHLEPDNFNAQAGLSRLASPPGSEPLHGTAPAQGVSP